LKHAHIQTSITRVEVHGVEIAGALVQMMHSQHEILQPLNMLQTWALVSAMEAVKPQGQLGQSAPGQLPPQVGSPLLPAELFNGGRTAWQRETLLAMTQKPEQQVEPIPQVCSSATHG